MDLGIITNELFFEGTVYNCIVMYITTKKKFEDSKSETKEKTKGFIEVLCFKNFHWNQRQKPFNRVSENYHPEICLAVSGDENWHYWESNQKLSKEAAQKSVRCMLITFSHNDGKKIEKNEEIFVKIFLKYESIRNKISLKTET